MSLPRSAREARFPTVWYGEPQTVSHMDADQPENAAVQSRMVSSCRLENRESQSGSRRWCTRFFDVYDRT